MFPSRTAPAGALLALGLAALLPGLALAQVKPQPVQVKPATATAATGGAALIEQTTFEAGDVHKGEVVNHDFIIKNSGKTDLLILDVKPACGCTTPGFDKIVPPGGTGKITLKVDTSTFKGPISKTANVTTNDPQNSNIRLAINANVTTYVEVLPRDSVFFRQSLGEEKREELTIKSNEPGEFKIKDVQVSGANVKHEMAPVAGKPGEYKLALWMDPSTPVGNFSGSVKILTNSPKEPEVRITVNGSILGQLSVNPSTLFFRVDSGTKEVVAKSGTLELRERGEVAAPSSRSL